MNLMGAFATAVVIMVLWFNPQLINGIVSTVKAPFHDWQKSGKSQLPSFVVKPEDVPRPPSHKGEVPAERLIPTGDPGKFPEGADKLPEGADKLPENAPHSLGGGSSSKGSSSKDSASSRSNRHNGYKFGARAVGIQKARDL